MQEYGADIGWPDAKSTIEPSGLDTRKTSVSPEPGSIVARARIPREIERRGTCPRQVTNQDPEVDRLCKSKQPNNDLLHIVASESQYLGHPAVSIVERVLRSHNLPCS